MRPWATAAVVLMTLAGICRADQRASEGVQVGSKLPFRATTLDNKPISTADLEGHYVLIHLFASWSEDSIKQLPTLIEAYAKYHPKGLELIGLSLEPTKNNEAPALALARKTVADGKITWPVCLDHEHKISIAWGFNGVPAYMLLNTKGIVVWRGEAIDVLDAEIKNAMSSGAVSVALPGGKQFDVETAAQEIEASLQSKDMPKALRQWNTIPAAVIATAPPKLTELKDKLEQYGKEQLADAEKLIDQKQHAKAIARYQELTGLLGSLPSGQVAKKRADSMKKDPQIKAAILASEKAARAETQLAEARRLREAKKDDQAYPRYKHIATDFADTPAGAEAATVVKEYEQDAPFMQRLGSGAAEAKAKSLLSMANSYRQSGMSAKAQEKYRDVIAQFPGTPYAETAKKALAEMGQ